MSSIPVVLLSIAIALLILILRSPKTHIAGCEPLIEGLPKEGLFVGLKDYILADDIFADDAFWLASGRLSGLWNRCATSIQLLRIVQALAAENLVSKDDRRGIVGRLLVQIIFTLLGTVEAAICTIWDGLPHFFSRISLQVAASLAARTYTITNVEGAPECVKNLSNLL